MTEPYAVAGDVYAMPPHTGRGGWSWYTGSAAWLYRAGVESILGFALRGDLLTVEPCIPPTWPGFTITYRHGLARYRIVVDNPEGVTKGVRSMTLDNAPVTPGDIRLERSAGDHEVRIVMG